MVSIGNPFTLLNMERHSSKHCWSQYLKQCFNHNTLTVSKYVSDDIHGKLDMLKTSLFDYCTTQSCKGIVIPKKILVELCLILKMRKHQEVYIMLHAK